jgi:hypothetical protein
MTDEYMPPEFESFLIRFWHEPASHTWHGRVVHMSSRTSCDFVALEQAIAFMRRFVPALPAMPAMDDTRAD